MIHVKSRRSGFSAVEIILVLVIVGLIGTLGWVAYKNYRSTGTASLVKLSEETDSNTKASNKPPVDPTVGWSAFTSSDSKISLKYPKNWVAAAHPELCGDNILLIAPTMETVGTCASESFGMVSFRWDKSDQSCSDYGDDTAFTYDNGEMQDVSTDKTKETVSVAGVSGYKRTSTSTGNGPYANEAGTRSINYCFNTGGYMYVATYNQRPSDPDAKSDFNTIVTKTLKFSD